MKKILAFISYFLVALVNIFKITAMDFKDLLKLVILLSMEEANEVEIIVRHIVNSFLLCPTISIYCQHSL